MGINNSLMPNPPPKEITFNEGTKLLMTYVQKYGGMDLTFTEVSAKDNVSIHDCLRRISEKVLIKNGFLSNKK